MQTVTFYSYKGGVGRSLLLANVAYGLARLGKRVLAVDLDLEAPGLHFKFCGSASSGIVSKGVVRFLLECAASAQPDLDDYIVRLPDMATLHLLPAVPINAGNSYWDDFATFERTGLDGDPLPSVVNPLLALQERLAERAYDFLLVDARTGVTKVGAVATAFLADTVVLCTLDSDESLDGTAQVIRGLRSAPNRPFDGPRRLVPTLMRVPLTPGIGVSTESSEHTRTRAVDRLQLDDDMEIEPRGPQQWAPLCLVRQDTSLQSVERVVLREPDAVTTALSLDYVWLTRTIAPTSDVTPLVEALVQNLPDGQEPDVLRRQLAAIVEIAPSTLALRGLFAASLRSNAKLTLTSGIVAALLLRQAPEQAGSVVELVHGATRGFPHAIASVEPQTLGALQRHFAGLGDDPERPGPLVSELFHELAAATRPHVGVYLARLLRPWHAEDAVRLLSGVHDASAMLLRAGWALEAGDYEPAWGEALASVRADDSVVDASARILGRVFALDPTSNRAATLTAEPALVSKMAPAVAVAVWVYAGDEQTATIWLSWYLGRMSLEANPLLIAELVEALRALGAGDFARNTMRRISPIQPELVTSIGGDDGSDSPPRDAAGRDLDVP